MTPEKETQLPSFLPSPLFSQLRSLTWMMNQHFFRTRASLVMNRFIARPETAFNGRYLNVIVIGS